MQHRYGAFGEDAGNDDSFSERAIARLGQWQKNPFEEGGRLEQSLLQRHEQVEVEAFVEVDVVANARE